LVVFKYYFAFKGNILINNQSSIILYYLTKELNYHFIKYFPQSPGTYDICKNINGYPPDVTIFAACEFLGDLGFLLSQLRDCSANALCMLVHLLRAETNQISMFDKFHMKNCVALLICFFFLFYGGSTSIFLSCR